MTANHFAEKNTVVAIEPSKDAVKMRWQEKILGIEQRVADLEEYKQIAFYHLTAEKNRGIKERERDTEVKGNEHSGII